MPRSFERHHGVFILDFATFPTILALREVKDRSQPRHASTWAATSSEQTVTFTGLSTRILALNRYYIASSGFERPTNISHIRFDQHSHRVDMLPRLDPIPRFPPYQGPFQVGSLEYEIPVRELPSHFVSPSPEITTIKFRIFYPSETTSIVSKPVWWLPEPQHEWVSAYCRFLGIPSFLAEAASYVPSVLHHIKIPAALNTPLLDPTSGRQRWPVMVFSHGLGGSFNGYSFIASSLASYGMVVVSPEHRDGSAPVSIIRNADGPSTRINYQHLSHTPTLEVLDARNEQLRVRLWELDLLHQALLNLDEGKKMTNLAMKKGESKVEDAPTFESKLNVHEPGKISWAGHSFGAATVVQFLKSVFWRVEPFSRGKSAVPHLAQYQPLYEPEVESKLASQITPKSPLVLLDLWTMPLWGEKTRWLWERPLPCYADGTSGGNNVLAIMSEEFFKWASLLERTKRVLSRDPSQTEADSEDNAERRSPGPRLFYVLKSAHLSQSDFGLLFPWLMRKWVGAEEPERTMRLNLRAILQMLRESGLRVEPPTKFDMEANEDEEDEDGFVTLEAEDFSNAEEVEQDLGILAKSGKIRGWISVRLDGPAKPELRASSRTTKCNGEGKGRL